MNKELKLELSEYTSGANANNPKKKEKTFLEKCRDFKKPLAVTLMVFAFSGMIKDTYAYASPETTSIISYLGDGQDAIYSSDAPGEYFFDKDGNNLGMIHPDVTEDFDNFSTTRINKDGTLDRFLIEKGFFGKKITHIATLEPRAVEFFNHETNKKETTTFLVDKSNNENQDKILMEALSMMAEVKENREKFEYNNAVYGQEYFTAKYTGERWKGRYNEFTGEIALNDAESAISSINSVLISPKDFNTFNDLLQKYEKEGKVDKDSIYNNVINVDGLIVDKKAIFELFSTLSHEKGGHARVELLNKDKVYATYIDESNARVKQYKAEKEYIKHHPEYEYTDHSKTLNLVEKMNQSLNLSKEKMHIFLIVADLHATYLANSYSEITVNKFSSQDEYNKDVESYGADILTNIDYKSLENLNFKISSKKKFEQNLEYVDDVNKPDKPTDKYVIIVDNVTGKSSRINADNIFNKNSETNQDFVRNQAIIDTAKNKR